MKVSSQSILPVIEYIMNTFADPFNSPSDKNYSTISLLLSRFINQQISYEECYTAIDQITQDCKPLIKLKSILDVPPQPLPSDSDSDLSINYISYQDSNNQMKHQAVPLSVLSTTKKKCQNWSTIEDDRLICGIIRFGFDNWTTIANFVGNNRTRSQCNQRWARGLDPHISRDQWTSEESQKLINLVQVHGEKSWTHIASVMGNRSDIQCRYHFYQLTKRSRGYSFSNDTSNNPLPKVSNVSTRQSTPSINMPNYILPINYPNNYTKANTDTIPNLSNAAQTDQSLFSNSQNFFEQPPLSRQQNPFPFSFGPRISTPFLQNMPQIRSSSVAGISFTDFNNMNPINNLSNNNTSNMNMSNINNNNMNPNNNNNINNNLNINNNTMNNMNIPNSNLNRNMSYPPLIHQAQQGPPMPLLKGFPRLNLFNQQQQNQNQDAFFDTTSQNSSNSNADSINTTSYNNNTMNFPNNNFTEFSKLNENSKYNDTSNVPAFSHAQSGVNDNNNNCEEDDIDTVFQFASKYSGIDDLIDENGSWVVDRYKGYDVSREKYENEFIF